MDGSLGPPRPLSRKERRKLLQAGLVYAVAIGFGIALFAGAVPGVPAPATVYVTVAGHSYFSYGYFLPLPQLGRNSTPPASVEFHNVTFWVWTSGWYDPRGSYVSGNGTEPNGTTYSFVLGGSPTNASRVTTFVAPGGEFAAGWTGGYFLDLLVEVPVQVPGG